jgi:hypothetical protein
LQEALVGLVQLLLCRVHARGSGGLDGVHHALNLWQRTGCSAAAV